MKIIKLESENIKRLEAVEIKPDGSLIIIGGKNGAGKTSVLDSIQYALAGTDSIPSEPIRKGKQKAVVIVDLGDLKVTRIFTEKGSRLVVENKEGMIHRTPQAILDGLTAHLSFDPLEFARMDAKKQSLTLKNLLGLDFSPLDTEREQAYNTRTMVNRDIKSLEARITEMPDYDVPEEEISIGNLSGELERRMKINQANAANKAHYDDLTSSISRTKNSIEEIKEEIRRLEGQLTARTAELEAEQKDHAEAGKLIEAPDLDIEEIKHDISEAEATNSKIRSNDQVSQLKVDHAIKVAEADILTEDIKVIDKNKADLLASAEFPIEGLAFDENGVTHKGIPFDQCSSAEKLQVSVAMGIAMNPKLKVLLIRDGSLLDENNLSLIGQMAQKADAQVWLERVGEGKEVSVIIEDGSVKE